ncbi:hypothetical protein AMTRI_Chr02g263890 [Amborella trichopoda]
MKVYGRAINISASAPKLEVDNRISIRYYCRISDSLLRQARIFRGERNVIDLYIMLLRFSSLVSETIPCHRDYHLLLPREKILLNKKLLTALSELESLKPVVKRQIEELNEKEHGQIDKWGHHHEVTAKDPILSVEWPPLKVQSTFGHDLQQSHLAGRNTGSSHVLRKPTGVSQNGSTYTTGIDRPLSKLSLHLPCPKEETLSRHSILGPNGLHGSWQAPITGIRVHYPSNIDSTPIEVSGLNQTEECGSLAIKDGASEVNTSIMDTVLSLDDGRRSNPSEVSYSVSTNDTVEVTVQSNITRQPSPPPVLAHVQDLDPIPPSKVADPMPGDAQLLSERLADPKRYMHLHISVNIMEEFLRLARSNTQKNLETCGVLAGSLKNRTFYVTALIIPKQESTSDTCQTSNEEEIYDVQDKQSLFSLGWIHTHPTQSCFMSSVDLHTHYSYQIMLPEAIAIVMAPTDTSRTHGIYHLSDPGGVSVIRNCAQRGFHSHQVPEGGGPIYECCSHVYMDTNLKFEVFDLR